MIDRINDPQELKNVYEDPAYAKIRDELHLKLDGLRTKYGDSKELSQQYLDKYLDRLGKAKQLFGVNKEVTRKILEERKNTP